MRVLLCVHHRLDPDQGAPGTTLALGAALAQAGCDVEYLGYDHVFPGVDEERVDHQLRFPWLAARELHRRAGGFDVVDASTGDAWVWASVGRAGGRATALVTRAHGLEHVADVRARKAAREVGPALSWKYPLYHGGFRLWEVQRSLRLADHCVLLNTGDRDYVCERIGVPEWGVSVIPNAIADRFHDVPPAEPVQGPLQLAFVGEWIARKGIDVLVNTVVRLQERGVDFSFAVLGALREPEVVLADFPAGVRSRVSVTSRFANERLPELLAGRELFIFPSRSEGSSGALLEALACGLAAVATPVGAAPEVLRDGGGVLVDAEGLPDAVVRLASDRGALLEMRRTAQRVAARFRWSDVADRTIEAYERAVAAQSADAGRRGPSARG